MVIFVNSGQNCSARMLQASTPLIKQQPPVSYNSAPAVHKYGVVSIVVRNLLHEITINSNICLGDKSSSHDNFILSHCL